MYRISPTFDTRCILFINENCSRHKHFGSFLIVRPTTNMVQTPLQGCLDDRHGVFRSVKETSPCWLEGRLCFDHISCHLMPRRWGRCSPRRDNMGRCDRVVSLLHTRSWLEVRREVGVSIYRGVKHAAICWLMSGRLLRPGPVITIVAHLRYPTNGHVVSKRRHRQSRCPDALQHEEKKWKEVLDSGPLELVR